MTNSNFHIYLDSRDRSGGSATDFSINLPNSQINTSNKLAVSLESIILPNLEFPINSNNNKLYLSENDGATITITIPENSYTGAQLAATLKTELDAAGTLTYTVTFDTQSKKLTFSVGLPDFFEFLSGDNDVNIALGFQNGFSPKLTVFTSDSPVRLDGTEYVDLAVSSFSEDNIHSALRHGVIARIPLIEPFGGIIYYLNPDNHQSFTVNHDIFYRIRLRLLTPDGKLLQLPASSHVSIVFRAEEV